MVFGAGLGGVGGQGVTALEYDGQNVLRVDGGDTHGGSTLEAQVAAPRVKVDSGIAVGVAAGDKEVLRQQLEDINTKQKEIEAENAEVKKKFKESMDSIVIEINTSEAKPASKVLKDTVNKLKDVVK